MPYDRNAAKRLLVAAELELFDAGRRDAIGALGTAQLRAKIARTRRLRDKYRDLYRRQRVATRRRTGTKAGMRGDANLRTREKAAIFGELLARFARRFAEVEAAERRAASRTRAKTTRRARGARQSAAGPAPKRALPARRKSAKAPWAKARTGFMSPRAQGIDTRRQRQKSRGVVVRAHARSQGRRTQARRDRRR